MLRSVESASTLISLTNAGASGGRLRCLPRTAVAFMPALTHSLISEDSLSAMAAIIVNRFCTRFRLFQASLARESAGPSAYFCTTPCNYFIFHRVASFSGDPGRIRTCNLPLRRGLLYPVEPRGRASLSVAGSFFVVMSFAQQFNSFVPVYATITETIYASAPGDISNKTPPNPS